MIIGYYKGWIITKFVCSTGKLYTGTKFGHFTTSGNSLQALIWNIDTQYEEYDSYF